LARQQRIEVSCRTKRGEEAWLSTGKRGGAGRPTTVSAEGEELISDGPIAKGGKLPIVSRGNKREGRGGRRGGESQVGKRDKEGKPPFPINWWY